MKAVVGGVLGVLLAAGLVCAEVPTPGPEHEELGYWVGTWKVDVENKESALGPAGKELWTFTFEWFPGQFHVVLRSELSGSNGKTADLALFGCDGETGAYFFDEITSSGMWFPFKGVREGKVWRFDCSRTLDGKPSGIRWAATESSTDIWTYQLEVSLDGGPWVLAQEGRANRAR